MIIHILILISVVLISSFGVSQYAYTHDLNQEPTPSISKVAALLTFSLLIFFGAQRTDYIDTGTYVGFYRLIEPGMGNAFSALFNEEHGLFAFINTVIKTVFGDNEVIYLLIMILIPLGAYIKLFRKYSVNYAFTAFLFMTSMEYTMMLNGIRQTTAIALMLYVTDAFFDKKFFKFFIFAAAAYLIHPSVLIWIPVYFFVHEKPWSKKMVIFFVGIAFAVLFLDLFTNVLDNMTEGTDYAGYVSTFKDDDGVNFIRVLFYAIIPILAFIKRTELEDAPDYINICINLSAVSAAVYLIGMFTSGILIGRLPAYFTPFNWVLVPYILDSKRNPNNAMLKIGFYALYTAYFMYNMFFTDYGTYVSKNLNISLLN